MSMMRKVSGPLGIKMSRKSTIADAVWLAVTKRKNEVYDDSDSIEVLARPTSGTRLTYRIALSIHSPPHAPRRHRPISGAA